MNLSVFFDHKEGKNLCKLAVSEQCTNLFMDDHSNHGSVAKSQGNSLVSVKTLGICLTLVAVALIALFVFKVPVNTLLLGGVLLACPLMHFWMMRGEHSRTMKDDGHKH